MRSGGGGILRVGRDLSILAAAALLACGRTEPGDAAGGGRATPPWEAGARRAAANRPPVIRAVHLRPDPPLSGAPASAEVEASDPDGDRVALGFVWTLDGQRLPGDGSSLVLPERVKGQTLEVRVAARDRWAESEPVSASARVGNRPPEMVDLLLQPGSEVKVGSRILVSPHGEDPDGDPIHFDTTWLVNGSPVDEPGLVLSTDRLHRGDVVEVEASVSDGDDESAPLKSPPVHVVNSAPVITSKPGSWDGRGPFHYALRVADADGDRLLRFRLLRGPKGMTLDWLRGELAWSPGPQQVGRHAVEVQVDDQHGGIATQAFELELHFEPPAPPPAAPAPERSEAD